MSVFALVVVQTAVSWLAWHWAACSEPSCHVPCMTRSGSLLRRAGGSGFRNGMSPRLLFWPENDHFRSFRIKWSENDHFQVKINSTKSSLPKIFFTNFTKIFSEKQISLKFQCFPLKLSGFYWNLLEYSNFTGIIDFEKSSGTGNYWKFQIVLVTTKIFSTQSTGS